MVIEKILNTDLASCTKKSNIFSIDSIVLRQYAWPIIARVFYRQHVTQDCF